MSGCIPHQSGTDGTALNRAGQARAASMRAGRRIESAVSCHVLAPAGSSQMKAVSCIDLPFVLEIGPILARTYP